ncbi:MAG: outer membrane beta-barrel protein [Candidatus Cloacimonetes bacterium]|nr:outer membrane beta-barrel protein [Candidatus Cloacimonadota bacterium]
MNKKIALIICILLTLSVVLSAVPNLIVMSGVNFSNQKLEYLKTEDIFHEEFDYKVGTLLNINLEYGSSDYIKILFGARYSEAGMKRTLYTTENTEIGSQKITTSNSLNCLEFPVIIKINLLKTRIKPFVASGLYYRFILDYNQFTEINTINVRSENYEWEFSRMKDSLGWELVLGLSVNIEKYRLIMQYSKKSDISYPYNVDGLRMKSYAHEFSIGVSIPLQLGNQEIKR